MKIPIGKYLRTKAARSHLLQGFQHEDNAHWNDALGEFGKAAQICRQLAAPMMESYMQACQARVLRNTGQLKQAFDCIDLATLRCGLTSDDCNRDCTQPFNENGWH
jgi:hypothetical protein